MERKQEQLNKIIREFHKRGMLQEFLGMEDSFELAVKCWYKNTRGTMSCCPHQWRVRNNALNQILEKLNDQKERIAQACSFEELYKIIEENRVRDIGDLTTYDIAVRLGYLQTPKILPQDFVYLHAGTKEGAQTLYRCGLLRTKPTNVMKVQDFDALEELKKLDKELHHLPHFATYSMLIENFLCVKKDDLKEL